MIPSAETVSPSIMTDEVPAIHSGISAINSAINPIIEKNFSPAPGASANPLQVWIPILAAAWIAGIQILLGYICISYLRLQKKIGTAVLLRGNIYQSENVVSPFVLGVVKPKIYLPFSISAEDLSHVVAHEEAHISRKDHLWKPLGFLLLTLHWFNPLMWLGYILLCRDIELACDEKVIKQLDTEGKADYSQALLTCSANRRSIAACPLAFGEVGVKERVKTVLKYKKAALWVTVVAVVLCVFFAACTLTDPKTEIPDPTDPNQWEAFLKSMYPEYLGLDASNGLDVIVWQMAKGHYSFGLLPHAEVPRNHIDKELLNLKPVSAYAMSNILKCYSVDKDKIYIIPWQNPVSSYIAEYWMIKEGESEAEREARRAEYIEDLRYRLLDFGAEFPNSICRDSITVDIDGDGKKEMCMITLEALDAYSTYYQFRAREIGEKEWEYDGYIMDTGREGNIVTSYTFENNDLSFAVDELGQVYIKAQCREGDITENRRVDIAFLEGTVQFLYKGELLAGRQPKTTLMFAEPSLSWVISDIPPVYIWGGELLSNGKTLAETSKITLTQELLGQLMDGYGGQYSQLAESILQNTSTAYEIYPVSPESVDLYYLLVQEGGGRILVYGHYENGEKNGFIRWIFKTG